MSHTPTRRHPEPSRTFRRQPPAGTRARLTPRETEIVRLISEGYRSAEIADLLSIAVKTVETHRANVYNKLGITRMAGLVRYAVRERLISA